MATTEIATTEANGAPPAAAAPTFPVQLAEIDQLRAEYMALAVTDLADKKQLETVRTARLKIKKLRCGVENTRKAVNEDRQREIREVNDLAKKLTEPLKLMEDHLQTEEDKPKREAERLAFEAEQAKKTMIRERLKLLANADCIALADDVSELSDEEFDARLTKAMTAKHEREDKEAAEAEARRVEAEKLAKERAELDRLKAEQAAELEELRKLKAELTDAEAIKQQAEEASERIAQHDAANQLASNPDVMQAVGRANAKRASDTIDGTIDTQADREKLKDFSWKLEGIECPKLSEAYASIEAEIRSEIVSFRARIAAILT